MHKLEKEDLIAAIPGLMLDALGDLSKVSRNPTVPLNAMELRKFVSAHPEVRSAYHKLLTEQLGDYQVHIVERIMNIAQLQQEALGDEFTPSDPKAYIDLSKELSRLISEGKTYGISANADKLETRESAKEILSRFLEGY